MGLLDDTYAKAKALAGLLADAYQTGAQAYFPNEQDVKARPELAKGLLQFVPGPGDAISGYDAMQSARQGNYGEAALNGVGLLPFIPAMGGIVKTPSKLYRGVVDGMKESGDVGLGTYMLGKGVYSSPSKKFARKYGDIIELDPLKYYPSNPLVLDVRPGASAPDAFAEWALKESGMKNMREFNKKFSDPGEFVKSMGFDGVVAGDEVVKY